MSVCHQQFSGTLCFSLDNFFPSRSLTAPLSNVCVCACVLALPPLPNAHDDNCRLAKSLRGDRSLPATRVSSGKIPWYGVSISTTKTTTTESGNCVAGIRSIAST